ncbi:MAG: 50S ribosomal protein L10 [Bacteroidetes bacterium]|nr:50S ribosomal protein L10 [Bacteroidota bacterium]
MNRAQKKEVIDGLTVQFNESSAFYITDASGMSVADVNDLRRVCFKKGIQLKVAKNTLIEKAFDVSDNDYEEVKKLLKGPTAIMFSQTGNLPAKVLKEFRGKDGQKPLLKGAYIDASVFIGDDKLEDLTKLKSKEEVLGDVILLLQSPIKNVVSALSSGGQTIAGLVKALEERN